MCPPPHNATTLKRSHFWQWSKLVCCIEISIQLNMQCAHFNAYIVLYNDCMVIGLWWSSHIWVIYSYNVLCINWISISHPRYVVILLYSLYFMYYWTTLALFHWFWLFCYWPNSIYWHCALDLVNVVRMTWYAFGKSSAVCSSGMHMLIVLGKKPVRAHLLVLLCYHVAIIFDAKYHKKCHSE